MKKFVSIIVVVAVAVAIGKCAAKLYLDFSIRPRASSEWTCRSIRVNPGKPAFTYECERDEVVADSLFILEKTGPALFTFCCKRWEF